MASSGRAVSSVDLSATSGYDPFGRGPHPVGVRSRQIVDARRADRTLPFEVWYPAAAGYFGLDLNPATQDTYTLPPDDTPLPQAAVRDAAACPGRFPLVLFSHTSRGHRRQSTFLCTHLASHGYVVAAVDHIGNSFGEWPARIAADRPLTPEELAAYLERIVADRVPDVRCLAAALLGGAAGEVSAAIDADRLGLVGWSFGGWTVLAVPEVDARFGAVVALAPAGSSNAVPGTIPVTLTFAWPRAVPTLYLAAERDRWTPVPGIAELCARTPAPAQLVVLRHADHDHFGDHIEPELCPRAHAHLFTRALALAHLDAALKEQPEAQAFMAHDPAAVLREFGVPALAVTAAGDRDGGHAESRP